jgi:DNA-binding transcriptional LysR family regulator
VSLHSLDDGFASDHRETVAGDVADERVRFRFKLSQLRVLCAVAEAGSVNEAARGLGANQSTIGTALRTLERQLGIQLLRRGSGGRRLSARGLRLLPLARSVLAAADDFDASIERISNRRGAADAGRAVRIAAAPSAVGMLAAAMASLRLGGCNIPITFEEVEQPVGLRRLRTGACDLMIAPIPADEAAGLVLTAFAELPFRVLLPVGHALARADRPINWHDLRHHTVLLLDPDGLNSRCLGAALLKHGLTGYCFTRHRYQATLEADVRGGGRVGVLPGAVGAPLTGHGVIVRAMAMPAITLSLSLACSASASLSPGTLQVRERLVRWAAGVGPRGQ